MTDPADLSPMEFVRWVMGEMDKQRPRHPLEDEGWVYYDPPSKFTPECWEQFLAVFGQGNYQILVMSQGTDKLGPWVRGQLLVSPQGKANAHEEWLRGQTAH